MGVLVGSSVRKMAVLLLALVLVVAACDSESPPEPRVENQGNISPKAHQDDADPRTVENYAAVIRRLVTKDHTFGGAPSPFDHVFILDGLRQGAGDPSKGMGPPDKRFSREIKEALKIELASLPPIDFISDPVSVRVGKDLMGGVKKHGVIVTVGPIVGRGRNVKVSNSIWCGGLCGQWLTYRLKLRGGNWRIMGTVGPNAIS